MSRPILIRAFSDPREFEASHQAETFLAARGFSVGHRQRGASRGILFGDYNIQKWRNLNAQEIEELHGVMTGDGRNGPIEIFIFDNAPVEARKAFGGDPVDVTQ